MAAGSPAGCRETNGDTVGYYAWLGFLLDHRAAPYVVDVANSVVISFGWITNGSGNIQANLGNAWFGYSHGRYLCDLYLVTVTSLKIKS